MSPSAGRMGCKRSKVQILSLRLQQTSNLLCGTMWFARGLLFVIIPLMFKETPALQTAKSVYSRVIRVFIFHPN